MSITNSTLTTNFLRNLSNNLKQMQKYQNQLSSGKEVSKPSENPMLVSKIMDISNNILQNKQYNTNISDTIGWAKTQDTALGDVSAGLNRIRDLIIYGSNGSLADSDRGAIKDEVVVEINGLVDVLNTNFDGRYIFGGQKTKSKPFEMVGNTLNYLGDDKNVIREISKGVKVELLTNGGHFTTTSTATNSDLGDLLNQVVSAIATGDSNSLSDGLLEDIDKHIETVLMARSKVGALENRLDAAYDRNKAENLNLNTLLSEKEDIDIAEKYMEYSVMRTVYQASLSAGASVLQPSLLDYL